MLILKIKNASKLLTGILKVSVILHVAHGFSKDATTLTSTYHIIRYVHTWSPHLTVIEPEKKRVKRSMKGMLLNEITLCDKLPRYW